MPVVCYVFYRQNIPLAFTSGNGRYYNLSLQPYNVLAHELFHAWQFASKGAVAKGNLEIQAVQYINLIRKQQGMTLFRGQYQINGRPLRRLFP